MTSEEAMELHLEDKIEVWVRMVDSGDYLLQQIQSECWDHIHRELIGILRLEAMIFRSMELYSEVIKRSMKNNKQNG